MPFWTSPRRAAALAAFGLLAVAGCTGADGSTPSTSSTTVGSGTTASSSVSPSTGASPTASSSPMPSATRAAAVPAPARQRTEQGAIAFAEYYVVLTDKAYVTSDSEQVAFLATSACGACKVVVDGVSEMSRNGQRQLRPSVVVAGSNPLPHTSTDPVIDVRADVRHVDIVAADGAVVGYTPPGKRTMRCRVRWTDAGWRMHDMRVVKG